MNSDTVIAKALILALPEAVLIVTACCLFLGGTTRKYRHVWAWLSLAGLVLATISLVWPPFDVNLTPGAVFNGPIFLDQLAQLVKVIALAAGFILVLLSWKEVPDRTAPEFYGCLLLTVAGLSLVGAANDLVALFLALELISIPTYILLYLPNSDTPAQEAAIKYFLLSIFSSALLLFGFSYLYGLTGTTYLPDMRPALEGEGLTALAAPNPTVSRLAAGMLQVAVVLIVAGLGFKITAVPFHFYAPDVYQGTATVNAAILAFLPKAAGFVALIRVLGFFIEKTPSRGLAAAQILSTQIPSLLWILAAVTMTVGNILALLQDNLKRLLAYSSVSHSGYMLIGLAVTPAVFSSELPGGLPALLFYLVAYGAMTVGAFTIIAYLSTPPQPVENVDDLAGLSQHHPGLTLLMALFLLSLLGLPLTAGFAGKFLLFFAAFGVPATEPSSQLFSWLALIAVINSAIGAWYYLRIIAVMYLRSTVKPLIVQRSWPGLAALWLCAAVTLVFGIYPAPLLQLATWAVR